MKQMYLFACLALLAVSAQAQFSINNFSASASGNYTMYKGDFQEKTSGVKLGLGYSFSEKARLELAYTNHFAIKRPSSIDYSDGITSGSVNSEFKYNFSTVSLALNYTIVHAEESKFSLYALVIFSLVAVKYEENPKTPLPAGTIQSNQAAPGKDNGICGGVGVGAQYNFGPVRVFGDAGLSFPNNTNDGYYYTTYNYNPIPVHIVFNLGVRVPFGKRDLPED